MPCPLGQIGGLEFAPWGEIGFSFSSATKRRPMCGHWTPKNHGALPAWTQSETGGLDPGGECRTAHPYHQKL